MPNVETPWGAVVEFPDEMSRDEIAKVIHDQWRQGIIRENKDERGQFTKAYQAIRDSDLATKILGPSERTRLAEGIPNPDTGQLEYKPSGNEIERKGLVPGVESALLKPAVPIPTLEEKPNAGTLEAAGRAAANVGIGIANGIQSPLGAAATVFPMGRMALGAIMGADAPEAAYDTFRTAREGRKQVALENAARTVFDLLGAAGAVHEAPRVVEGIRDTATPPAPKLDAKQVAEGVVNAERARQVDEDARAAMSPVKENPTPTEEKLTQKVEGGIPESEQMLKRELFKRAVDRRNELEARNQVTGEEPWTPVDQFIAEEKYGVRPEREIVRQPEEGRLGFRREPVETAPNVLDETSDAFRRERARDARTAEAALAEERAAEDEKRNAEIREQIDRDRAMGRFESADLLFEALKRRMAAGPEAIQEPSPVDIYRAGKRFESPAKEPTGPIIRGRESKPIEQIEGGRESFRKQPAASTSNVLDETAEAFKRERAKAARTAEAVEAEPEALDKFHDNVKDILDADEAVRRAGPCL